MGDYGGGGMLLAVGGWPHCGAGPAPCRHRRRAGEVVDASIVDRRGTAVTEVYGMLHRGRWKDARGGEPAGRRRANYGVYRTDDGHHCRGPLEPGSSPSSPPRIGGGLTASTPRPVEWAELREARRRFATVPGMSGSRLFDGSDALRGARAVAGGRLPTHRTSPARRHFVAAHGAYAAGAAPRFGADAGRATAPAAAPARRAHNEIRADWGC